MKLDPKTSDSRLDIRPSAAGSEPSTVLLNKFSSPEDYNVSDEVLNGQHFLEEAPHVLT